MRAQTLLAPVAFVVASGVGVHTLGQGTEVVDRPVKESATRPATAPAAKAPAALLPEVQTAEWAQAWWGPRHKEKLAERDRWVAKHQSPRVVFLGDSITHGWEKQGGAAVWAERYEGLGAMNLGFSGDRTEQVLWRLGVGPAGEENNELAGLAPELVVLMIGTNNTGHRQDPPAETAAGVTAIIDRIHGLSPESRFLLLAVFPRGAKSDDPLRKINDGVNNLLEGLGEREEVEYLDIADAFLAADGTLPESVMPDLLHPNEEGYRRWAAAMAPTFDRMLAE